MRMASHTAMSPSSGSETRLQVGLPVSRRNSIHADESTRITQTPLAHVVKVAVPSGTAHVAGLVEAQRLVGEDRSAKFTASLLVAKW